MRGSVYCTASFSVCSLRRAKLSIIYTDIRLDYKLATLPQKEQRTVIIDYSVISNTPLWAG